MHLCHFLLVKWLVSCKWLVPCMWLSMLSFRLAGGSPNEFHCLPNMYQCPGTEQCIPIENICNGVTDCDKDSADEGAICSKYTYMYFHLKLCYIEVALTVCFVVNDLKVKSIKVGRVCKFGFFEVLVLIALFGRSKSHLLCGFLPCVQWEFSVDRSR